MYGYGCPNYGFQGGCCDGNGSWIWIIIIVFIIFFLFWGSGSCRGNIA